MNRYALAVALLLAVAGTAHAGDRFVVAPGPGGSFTVRPEVRGIPESWHGTLPDGAVLCDVAGDGCEGAGGRDYRLYFMGPEHSYVFAGERQGWVDSRFVCGDGDWLARLSAACRH